jgi:D-alanyl-D-alanine carboxypeptidase (penicillin-binding protein 5/6)
MIQALSSLPKPLTDLSVRWILVIALISLPCTLEAAPKAKNNKTAPTSKPAQHPGISKDPYIGAIVIDATSGKVVFEDQADAKGYPASVLKLMDLLLILERVEHHQLSFQDQVTVSAKAAKTGGSQVWLAEKEVFSVDDLLYALMVQSANDAAVALAEKAGGTTEAFVQWMNQRAAQLHMTNTVFHSVHGLPPGTGQEPDVTTPRDFARLCYELLRHQDTLRYTSTRERTFRPNAGNKTVIMRTHNHLMAELEGCDGFKTGYFTQAGFSIAATAARNGQRVIAVVLGSADRKVRDAKAAELVSKGLVALQSTPVPVAHTLPGAKPASVSAH